MQDLLAAKRALALDREILRLDRFDAVLVSRFSSDSHVRALRPVV